MEALEKTHKIGMIEGLLEGSERTKSPKVEMYCLRRAIEIGLEVAGA